MMFKSPQHYRTFLTLMLTYTLDLLGFSIVFPVLAPLLLDHNLHFFAASAPDLVRTSTIGLIFAIFGIAQFFGAPINGALADHYGRYKVFLGTIGLSVFGYALMALSIYFQSLSWLFVGRILTGLCSGNFALAQSTAADLTDETHRSKAFGILLGVGGLGFVAGPWVGGKLANPDWLFGSGAFIFAAIAALINFFFVLFFFVETWQRKADHKEVKLFDTFKDIRIVFHQKILRTLLIGYLLFGIGWGFFLIFLPTYLVQKFALGSDKIGDIYAYIAVAWFFACMFLNKELASRFSLRPLVLLGLAMASIGVAMIIWPQTLWPYWFIIPFTMIGAALAWVNTGTLLSLRASESMQGRAMGVGGSMWSIGQVIAPLIAGPLASWNMYSPMIVGACVILASFVYLLCSYRDKN